MFTRIKSRITKNPSYKKKDDRLEKIIKKYDRFLKRREAKRREASKTGHLLASQQVNPKDNPQLEFMREVLYNYLDKELKEPRQSYP